MISNRANARRILTDTLQKIVFSKLILKGFKELKNQKEPIPMWHFSRIRKDGDYDVISFAFDTKKRPLFEAVINIIPAEGIRQPWGEIIKGIDATALTPLNRVRIQKKHRNSTIAALGKWLGYGWFGFRETDSIEENKIRAEKACCEFATLVVQAEKWWMTRELGMNLVSQKIGAVY